MRTLSLFLSWYRLPVGIVLMVMCLRSTRRLVTRSAERGLIPSAPEAILTAVQDPYIVVVICMLVWAVWIGVTLSFQADLLVLLRFGSRARWAAAQCMHALREASVLLGILLAAATASSTGLPWHGTWTEAAAMDSVGVLLPRWVSTGVGPIAGIGLQLLLTAGGLVALFSLVLFAVLVSSRYRDATLVLASAVAFFGPLLLFKIPSGGVQSLITLIASRPPGWPFTPILVLVLVVVIVLGAARLMDAPLAVPARRALPFLGYGALVAVLMSLVGMGSNATSVSGLLRDTFYGSSPESFSLTQYVLYLLVFLGPGYVALLELDAVDLPRMPLIAQRHGRIWPWLRGILIKLVIASGATVFTVFAFELVLAAMTGRPLLIDLPTELWHHFGANSVLQLYVTMSAVVLVALLTGSDLAGLGVLVGSVVLGIPALTHGFAPAGATMIGLLDIEGYTPWRGTASLSAAAAGLTLVCFITTTYRAPQRLIAGRNRGRH